MNINTEVLVVSWEIDQKEIMRKPRIIIRIAVEENAGQNRKVKAGNNPFKSVTYFQYLGTAINQNCIHGETKIRLNSGNGC